MAETLNPIPKLTTSFYNFSDVVDDVASTYCQEIAATGKQAYLLWSGGIDSTSIVVAFLRNASSDVLRQTKILCTQNSIDENSYFYHRFIEPNFVVEDTYSFKITSDNYDKIICFDGELGDQCFYGHNYVYQLAMTDRFDLLNSPWKDNLEHCIIKNPKFMPASDSTVNFAMDLMVESIESAPIEIDTLYSFLWWTQYEFKWDENNLRKLNFYTSGISSKETEYFYKHGLRRLYSEDKMQIWSMLTLPQRHATLQLDIKYDAKQYIYQHDKNDFYFAHKQKSNSGMNWVVDQFDHGYHTLAVDENWKTYLLTSAADRSTIAEILQKGCV
jgi:hypothetical protein